MTDLRRQLELYGLDHSIRQAQVDGANEWQRRKGMIRVMTAHDIMSSLPEMEEMSFLHSGLAQTCLPHSKPPDDREAWIRSSGKFKLIITPGAISDDDEEGKLRYVGVPYGSKARLIMIYLQTEGVKGRTVSLGPNLSSFLRSLGLRTVSGGKNGSITSVRAQCMRIARCQFTMQWSGNDASGGRRNIVQDTKIVDGLELWTGRDGKEWAGTVELSERFQEHLREHAVPLDKRSLGLLADNSLALDLYTLFAYRLPRLAKPLHLRWEHLQAQIGTDYARERRLSEKVRMVMPDVWAAYPGAKVEVLPTGLTMYNSPPTVPEKTLVNGFRLVTG